MLHLQLVSRLLFVFGRGAESARWLASFGFASGEHFDFVTHG